MTDLLAASTATAAAWVQAALAAVLIVVTVRYVILTKQLAGASRDAVAKADKQIEASLTENRLSREANEKRLHGGRWSEQSRPRRRR